MRYVVSDIHGNYDLFVKLLRKIKFSQNDTIFVLGDVIDKGKDVSKLINLLFNVLGKNALVLLGNHEFEFINYVIGLISEDETDETIISKCKEFLKVKEFDFDDIDNLMNLQPYYEEKDFILVHAGVPCDENGKLKSLNNSLVEQLIYDRRFKDENFIPKDSKCVIFGHTPTFYVNGQKGKIIKYQKPNTVGNNVSDYYKVHIDTGNYLTGILGCLRLDDMQEFYVNEFED